MKQIDWGQMSKLMERKDSLDEMKALIEANHDNAFFFNYLGETPLMRAAENKRFDLVRFLIEDCGVDCEETEYRLSSSGRSALDFAVINNDLQTTRYLVEKQNMDPLKSKPANHLASPLGRGAMTGSTEVVKYLVSFLAEKTGTYDFLSLDYTLAAARSDTDEIMRFFVEDMSLDPDEARDESNLTPLCVACAYGRLETVKYLVEKCHVCLEPKETANEILPIHLAVYSGNVELMEYLIHSCKMNPNSADRNRMTPVFHAICRTETRFYQNIPEKSFLRIIQYLVRDCSVNPNSGCFRGLAPIHYAAFDGREVILKYLVNGCGVEVNTMGEGNITPLHSAVSGGRPEMVRLLLTLGADPNLKDGHGRTPLALVHDKETERLEKQKTGKYTNLERIDHQFMVRLFQRAGA